jgi:hypothetical protein
MNAVLYVEQGSAQALATNSFASITASSPKVALSPSALDQLEYGLELDSSNWVELDDNGTFLGVLKDGLLVMLRLASPETGLILRCLILSPFPLNSDSLCANLQFYFTNRKCC